MRFTDHRLFLIITAYELYRRSTGLDVWRRFADCKKVKQSAYALVTFTGPQGKQGVRVLATACSETLAPEEVVAEALTQAMGSITLLPAAAKTR